MKTIKIIIILISTLFFSCKTCPPSAVEPKSIKFFFSLIDDEGNDLFFGENSIYDPYNVKFAVGFNVHKEHKCFVLAGFYPREEPYIFYIEFISGKIDTMEIENHYIGDYEEPKGCPRFGIYKYDIYFNNTLICTDCTSDEIYKIEIK